MKLTAHQNGYSLTELMVVMIIIGLLILMVYPSYENAILQGRRAQARAALHATLLQQERYYTLHNTYFAFDINTPNSPFKWWSGDSGANSYYEIQAVLQKLSYAGNMVAKLYLDGEIDRETAIAMLMKYSLSDAERSEQRVRFIENLRSYVINYNLGQDVVQAYIERRAGTQDQDLRWQVLTDLLRSPKSASMMV